MKKLFLLLLAGGIMITACKKEIERPHQNENMHNIVYNEVKSCKCLDLVKGNYFIDGFFGNLYINKFNNQYIFK